MCNWVQLGTCLFLDRWGRQTVSKHTFKSPNGSNGEDGEVQFSLWNNKFDAGLIFCSKTQPKYSKSFVECFEISGGWYYYRSKYFF